MALALMLQTRRRASVAARATRGAARLSDFLDKRRMITPAPANTDYVAFPVSSFVPFLGIAKRWLPVIGVIELVQDVWELYNLTLRPAAWRMAGWTLSSQCGPMAELNAQLPGITCNFSNYTHAVWASTDGQINTAVAPLYRASFHYDVEVNPNFPTLTRARNSALWVRNDTQVPPAPRLWPLRHFWQRHDFMPVPNPLPMLDPLSLPYNAPPEWPDPLPLSSSPHRKRNPFRVAQYQRQAAYELPPVPHLPGQPPEAGLPVVDQPIQIVPGRVTYMRQSVVDAVPQHNFARPRKYERQGKVRVRGYKLVQGAMNLVTESSDAINAVYEALPDRYKQFGLGKHNEARKLQLLYRHWKHLDIPKAVRNVIKEQLKDMAYGTPQRWLARYSQRHAPHGSLPLGYASGPAL